MTTQDRDTLKKYFGAGSRPTAEQFGDLIDSALIMDDEGFSKTIPDGLRVVTKGAADALISFQRPASDTAEWSVGFNKGLSDQLMIKRGPLQSDASPILTCDAAAGGGPRLGLNGNVLIGAPEPKAGRVQPRSALEVMGAVRAEGRVGREWIVPADGKPHPITGDLSGCSAFEVIAGVGEHDNGRFALIHAVALNTYNPAWWKNLLFLKKPIRSQQAHYSRWGDRLKLEWIPNQKFTDPNKHYGKDSSYSLMIRSLTDYGSPNIKIRALVTRLWYDSHMNPNAAPLPADSQFIPSPSRPAASAP